MKCGSDDLSSKMFRSLELTPVSGVSQKKSALLHHALNRRSHRSHINQTWLTSCQCECYVCDISIVLDSSRQHELKVVYSIQKSISKHTVGNTQDVRALQ